MANRFSRGGKILEGKTFTDFLFYCFNPMFFCSSNQQRSQKIFKASTPMDLNSTRTRLIGFGMQLLDGIDPNPDNFVCAGIVHMRTQQVGCLLRLEPNKNAQMYRLTVRSSKESVSVEVCDLLADQF